MQASSTPFRRLGPRWWFIAAVGFAFVLVGSARMALVFVFLAAATSPEFGLTQLAVAALIFLAVSAAIGAGVATVLELLMWRSGHPDRAKHGGWMTVCAMAAAVAPALVLPLIFKSVTKEIQPAQSTEYRWTLQDTVQVRPDTTTKALAGQR